MTDSRQSRAAGDFAASAHVTEDLPAAEDIATRIIDLADTILAIEAFKQASGLKDFSLSPEATNALLDESYRRTGNADAVPRLLAEMGDPLRNLAEYGGGAVMLSLSRGGLYVADGITSAFKL